MFKFNYQGDEITVKFVYPGDRKTLCLFVNSVGTIVSSDEAHCHPNDQFVKAIGRKVALKKVIDRYVGDFPDQKDYRRQIWNAYFESMQLNRIKQSVHNLARGSSRFYSDGWMKTIPPPGGCSSAIRPQPYELYSQRAELHVGILS